jgi:Tfp pilus assembly protein PilF
LRQAIEFSPNDAPAHHALNVTLLNLGRREEALAAAERAVVLDPLSTITNNWLGWARMNVGRFDDALVAFRQAIEIDPTMASAYSNIGDVHSRGFGRLDTSMAWYEKASSLDPGNPEYPATIALRHWDLGNDGEARRWLDRALALGEGTAYTNFVAADLYFERGEEASTRKHAQLAAAMDPWTIVLIRDHDIRQGHYAAARDRYAKAYPELFSTELPKLTDRAAFATIKLALVLQHTGEGERAEVLLDRGEAYLRTAPRMGRQGYGISDVAIHALRGERTMALAKLREAERAGWRQRWRYARDFDPDLASLRNEPEFKAVFADIERDMARQRARLAALPKDAPLELKATGT